MVRLILRPIFRAARDTFRTPIAPPNNTYDQLFRRVESGALVVRVPEFCGSFEIDCRSHILPRLLTESRYEPTLVDIVRRFVDPSRDVIDVGANIGLYTVLMSTLINEGSRVLAVEPTPGALKHLFRNIQANHCTNVVVFEGVAARTATQMRINVITGMEEYSTLANLIHPAVKGKPYEQVAVAGETIDHLVEKLSLRPGFIKIDTEGTEHEVLLGSQNTIERYRPVIMCEMWPDPMLSAAGVKPGLLTGFLSGLGYRIAEDLPGEILAIPNNRPDRQ